MYLLKSRVLNIESSVFPCSTVLAFGICIEVWEIGFELGVDFGYWSPSIIFYYPRQKEEK